MAKKTCTVCAKIYKDKLPNCPKCAAVFGVWIDRVVVVTVEPVAA